MIPKPIRSSQLKRRRTGPPRRSSRSLNPAYLAFLSTLPCFACYWEVYANLRVNAFGYFTAQGPLYGRQKSPTEAAHIGLSTDRRGLSQKYPDQTAIPLCAEHHTEGAECVHKGVEKFFERLGTDRDSVIRTFQGLWRTHNG